jgi:transcriptional antiterminator RfaH
MKYWYLVQSKPKAETLAQNNLLAQNYTVYCPKITLNQKIQSLFPRYLFVYLDSEKDNFSPIHSTKGVANFVRFGVEFARISGKIIKNIQSKEVLMRDKISHFSQFKKGEKLHIKNGAFSDCEAIFSEYNADKRVIVLLKIMGQEQKIELQPNQIEKR